MTGVLLGMLLRMGLPLLALGFVTSQGNSELLDSGFRGLLTLNYLIALPLETAMSLVYVNKGNKLDPKLVQHPARD